MSDIFFYFILYFLNYVFSFKLDLRIWLLTNGGQDDPGKSRPPDSLQGLDGVERVEVSVAVQDVEVEASAREEPTQGGPDT